jgi:hypothetical protein
MGLDDLCEFCDNLRVLFGNVVLLRGVDWHDNPPKDNSVRPAACRKLRRVESAEDMGAFSFG